MKQPIILCALFLASVFNISEIDHGAFKTVSLSGKVSEEETNSPVASKLTISTKDFGSFEVATDSRGEFSTTVPEGECKISVRAKGFESQEDVMAMSSDESRHIEIHLVPYIKFTIDGTVLSSKDHKPLKAALKIYRNSDFILTDSKLIPTGKFSQEITEFGWYLLDFSATGYLDAIDTVWVTNSHRKVHKDVELTPIETGLTVQLKNIYFDFGKSSLAQDSNASLDQLINFFRNNPTTQVEIAGHTDSDGPDDYNLILSQNRAQAVVDYLVKKGVDQSQLFAKGYGETKPIDANTTREGKANNRRVEMVVVKK